MLILDPETQKTLDAMSAGTDPLQLAREAGVAYARKQWAFGSEEAKRQGAWDNGWWWADIARFGCNVSRSELRIAFYDAAMAAMPHPAK